MKKPLLQMSIVKSIILHFKTKEIKNEKILHGEHITL